MMGAAALASLAGSLRGRSAAGNDSASSVNREPDRAIRSGSGMIGPRDRSMDEFWGRRPAGFADLFNNPRRIQSGGSPGIAIPGFFSGCSALEDPGMAIPGLPKRSFEQPRQHVPQHA